MKMWGPLLALFLAIAWWMMRQPPPPQRPLVVAANSWIGNEAIFSAAGAGRNSSFKAIRLANATDVSWAFKNRSADIVSLTLDEALRLAQNDHELVVLTILDWSEGADALVMRDDSHGLAGLRGARVAYESGALGQFVLHRISEQAGLEPADLKLVQLPVNEHLRAWKEGRIDAAVNFEPELSRLSAAGAKKVWDSRRIPGEIIDCLVTRRSLVQEQPAAVGQVLAALGAEVAAALAREPEQMRRFAAGLGIGEAELRQSLDCIHLLRRDEADRHLRSPVFAATAERLQEELSSIGLLKVKLAVSNLLPPALPR